METHSLQTLRTILSTGSPLKAQSYDYVYKCIKSSVLLGSISGAPPTRRAGVADGASECDRRLRDSGDREGSSLGHLLTTGDASTGSSLSGLAGPCTCAWSVCP